MSFEEIREVQDHFYNPKEFKYLDASGNEKKPGEFNRFLYNYKRIF